MKFLIHLVQFSHQTILGDQIQTHLKSLMKYFQVYFYPCCLELKTSTRWAISSKKERLFFCHSLSFTSQKSTINVRKTVEGTTKHLQHSNQILGLFPKFPTFFLIHLYSIIYPLFRESFKHLKLYLCFLYLNYSRKWQNNSDILKCGLSSKNMLGFLQCSRKLPQLFPLPNY